MVGGSLLRGLTLVDAAKRAPEAGLVLGAQGRLVAVIPDLDDALRDIEGESLTGKIACQASERLVPASRGDTPEGPGEPLLIVAEGLGIVLVDPGGDGLRVVPVLLQERLQDGGRKCRGLALLHPGVEHARGVERRRRNDVAAIAAHIESRPQLLLHDAGKRGYEVGALGVAQPEVVTTTGLDDALRGRALVQEPDIGAVLVHVGIEDHQARDLAGDDADGGVGPLAPPLAHLALGGQARLVGLPLHERLLRLRVAWDDRVAVG